jgi:methyl-accepting chemotaxis protein
MWKPAVWLLEFFGLKSRYTLICALFLLPQVLALTMLWRGSTASGLMASLNGEPLTVALLLVPAMLAVYLVGGLYVSSQGRMGRLRVTIERIASGDLSVASQSSISTVVDRSEAARLQRAAAQMSQNLVAIVNQVRTSSNTIAQGAREMADGNTNLSQRTEEQASMLEETASGMEQLAATVAQNAESCKRASVLAGGTSEVASKAADETRAVAQTMAAIERSSKHVADIIGVIEGIAFQTNILALNAAVEAARAGEQGRGFAVVAAEVRSLAQRSAEAAKEIKTSIAESAGAVAQGSRLAGAAGKTMDEVVSGISQVTELIREIAAASAEQSRGVDDTNQAIVQMDHVTQQNAALVEQATAAAHAFEDEAARLVEVVGAFKIDRMADRDRAVALVKKAVAHLRRVGVDRASGDFQNPNGGFVSGELFILAFSANGRGLAHPFRAGFRGTDAYQDQDADGRFMSREMYEAVHRRGAGWTDYRIVNPASGRIAAKSAYAELSGDVVLACGIYKEPDDASTTAVSAVMPAAVSPEQARSNAKPRLLQR